MAFIEPGLEGDAGEYQGSPVDPSCWGEVTTLTALIAAPSRKPKTRRINSLVYPFSTPPLLPSALFPSIPPIYIPKE
eukprot:superscaffoldBa00000221_g2855